MAWKYVAVGWMTGMYICAAFTPALLWLADRWPPERRAAYAGLHLVFSVVFSIVATVVEVPLLIAMGVFPSASPPPSIAAGVRVMLSAEKRASLPEKYAAQGMMQGGNQYLNFWLDNGDSIRQRFATFTAQ